MCKLIIVDPSTEFLWEKVKMLSHLYAWEYSIEEMSPENNFFESQIHNENKLQKVHSESVWIVWGQFYFTKQLGKSSFASLISDYLQTRQVAILPNCFGSTILDMLKQVK